jgi:undecaprenyl-diphosphatase
MRTGLVLLALLSPHASMAILAVVQGVTEFLPVSSSGHLVLAQFLLDVGQGSILEDVMLHLGTLVAVVVYYRRDLVRLTRDVVRFDGDERGTAARAYVAALAVATVPAVVVGLGLKDGIETLFDSVPLVLAALAVTGTLLFATRWIRHGTTPIDMRRALLIGVAQAVAIVPGCSRSGWTIATALLVGVPPAEAARFSFLMSIPVILGASVVEIRDASGADAPFSALGLGIVLSALVGLASLWWLVRLVRGMRLHLFSYYLWVVALGGALAWALRG